MINAVFALLMWQQCIFSLFSPGSPFRIPHSQSWRWINRTIINPSPLLIFFCLMAESFQRFISFRRRKKNYIFYKELNFYNCLRSSWVVDGRSHTWGIADNPSYATANHVAQTKQLFLCCNCIDWKNTWSLDFYEG